MVQSNGSTLVINKTDTEQLTRSEVEEAYDRVETSLRNSSEISQDSEHQVQQIEIEYNANAQESTALEGTAQAEENTVSAIIINKNKYEKSSFEYAISIISSEWIITGSLGAIVCIGWYTKNPEVLYLSPALVNGRLILRAMIYFEKWESTILSLSIGIPTILAVMISYPNADSMIARAAFGMSAINMFCTPNFLDTSWSIPIIGAMTFLPLRYAAELIINGMLLQSAYARGERIDMNVFDKAIYSLFDKVRKAPGLTAVGLLFAAGGALLSQPSLEANLKKFFESDKESKVDSIINNLLAEESLGAINVFAKYLAKKGDISGKAANFIVKIGKKHPQRCALEAMKLFFENQQYDMLDDVINKFNGKDAKMAIDLAAPYLKIEDARSKADDIIITLAKNFPKDCMLKTMELLYQQLNDSNKNVREAAKVTLKAHSEKYPFFKIILSSDTNTMIENKTFTDRMHNTVENKFIMVKRNEGLESFKLSEDCKNKIHEQVNYCFTAKQNDNACDETQLINKIGLECQFQMSMNPDIV